MNAITRARGSETPTSSAATSLSRTKRIARPVRLAKRLAMKKNATAVTTIVMSASHIVLTRSIDVWALKKLVSQCGGVTAVGSWRPASPPVHDVNELTIAVKATAKASVMPARYGPRRRVAGSPKSSPTSVPQATAIKRVTAIGVEVWCLAQIATASAPTPMNALLPSEICPDAPVRKERPSKVMDIAAPIARLKLVIDEKKYVAKRAASRTTIVSVARESTGWA